MDEKEEEFTKSEFTEVIINLLDYYSFKGKVFDTSDAWKRDTKYESDDRIPTEIDDKIKELFIETITTLIHAEKNKRKTK